MSRPEDPFAPPPDDGPGDRAGGTGPPGPEQPPRWQGQGGWQEQGGAGQAPYGQAPYGQAPYGQAPYGQAPYGAPRPQGTNGLAIASLVCAFLCTPVGLVLGFVAKSQIRRTGQAGNGLATAGIVVSLVNMVLGVLAVSAGFGPETGGAFGP